MGFVTTLMPHQVAAVEKMRHLKVGALYMEQGTGKTRTALELVNRRIVQGKVERILWLCPCSVKASLEEDICIHMGSMPEYIQIAGIESLSSSKTLYLDLLDLVKNRKCYLIVDESNLVKNFNAKRTQNIIKLAAECQYKLLLNGTPVSRNEADMFAQWFILNWRILGYQSYYSFAANHLEFKIIVMPDGREIVDTSKIVQVLNIPYLVEKISPYVYQIKKSECLKLPDKRYHVIKYEMDEAQREIYKNTKLTYLAFIDEIRPETVYKLFSALQHVVSGRQVITAPKQTMETVPLWDDWRDNPRIAALEKGIEAVGEEKCIIFAKYHAEIEEIAAYLADHGKTYAFFHGELTLKQREKSMMEFKGDTQFLISNKACGAYGLNLQFCHNIIYYSNDFDFATRQQSEDRVHRFGQDHEVHIYDIECEHSIDDFILRCLLNKESMVMQFKFCLKDSQTLSQL